MPRAARVIKKEIKSIKQTLKILKRPENLDLEVIERLKELLRYLKDELNE